MLLLHPVNLERTGADRSELQRLIRNEKKQEVYPCFSSAIHRLNVRSETPNLAAISLLVITLA